MLCAISGETPEVPVASRKTGTVFEKRLIEAYIAENGKDPVTGDELTVDDLVELHSARVVKPRPPTLTSIPALLSVFQSEWDAVALETFTLKQHLSQLRQELSTALYNNDAAVRVIARLTKERDEARDALAKVSVQDRRNAAASATESMQIDQNSMPTSLLATIDATQEKLSKSRRKRPIPEGWASVNNIQALQFSEPVQCTIPGSNSMAIDSEGNTAALGGANGEGSTISIPNLETTLTFQLDGSPMNDVVWANKEPDGSKLIVATVNGTVGALLNGQATLTFQAHAGPATGLAYHPGGSLVASVGKDKSFVFYDLSAGAKISQVYTDTELLCCQFHPDGHLLACGGNDGQIKVFDTRTFDYVANYQASGPITSLSFSENGTWLAAAMQDMTIVGIFDLRKDPSAALIKTLDFGDKISCVRWDYSAQYLVGAGPSCVAVQYYDKGSKSWTEPLRKACSATAVAWGSMAKSLVVLNQDGAVSVLA